MTDFPPLEGAERQTVTIRTMRANDPGIIAYAEELMAADADAAKAYGWAPLDGERIVRTAQAAFAHRLGSGEFDPHGFMPTLPLEPGTLARAAGLAVSTMRSMGG